MTTAVEIDAAKHLMDKGIPINGAVAIASVFYYESKLNPGSQGNQPSETPGVLNSHGAVAIMSLNGPRQKHLADFAAKHGVPWNNLYVQLDFSLNEMANYYPRSWAAIRSNESVSAIIAVLVAEYENPADHAREINGASATAESLFVAVKDYVPSSTPPPIVPTTVPGVPIMPTSIETALLQQLFQAFGPVIEAAFAGMIKGLASHLAGTSVTPTGQIMVDPTAIVKAIEDGFSKLQITK